MPGGVIGCVREVWYWWFYRTGEDVTDSSPCGARLRVLAAENQTSPNINPM